MSTNGVWARSSKSARGMADMTGWGGRGVLVEGAQTGDFLSQDQRMDVVRPLVGVHRFEICEMPHRLILGQDAVRAQQASCFTRDIGRHAHVIALGERDLLLRRFAVVLQATQLETEKLSLRA